VIPLILLAVLTAMFIGFCGRNYRFGFWGYFFVSILLTPIIGALMLIAAIPSSRSAVRKTARRA
jgi:uncharacterized membrane protein